MENSKINLIIVEDKDEIVSDHMCYIIKSSTTNRIYIGYTTNFNKRLRQHNGEITGGAKKTSKGRPWYPICNILGFYEKSSALRFEYRLQHSKPKININNLQKCIDHIIINGDGNLKKDNKMDWPKLTIKWHFYRLFIDNPKVINHYL